MKVLYTAEHPEVTIDDDGEDCWELVCKCEKDGEIFNSTFLFESYEMANAFILAASDSFEGLEVDD